MEDNAISISKEENCSLETRLLFVFSTREQSLCQSDEDKGRGGLFRCGGGVIFLANSASCVISEDTNCRQNNH